MRKLFVGLVILTVLNVASFANAQQFFKANQFTCTWDPVTTLVDGTPIPATDQVSYVTWMKNANNGVEPVKLSETSATQYTATLSAEGRYLFGVQAVRKAADGTLLAESTISWSDMPEATGDNPWGVEYFFTPASPTNLQPQQ